ncbi:MAG TPA: class I SAM-dependent methyltransferase [Pseudolabrys sp.]|jgi:SAM-dependent methyltransferase
MDDARGPKIDPSERTQQPIVKAGIGGGASLSMQRRTLDSRFARRYFVGYGIDVGGGDDSLHQFVELFPLIENVFVYDKAQGDAQKLDNVDDAAFDFLFSSHCLEHVYDPVEAMSNWLRVVRSGGHLVICVPDEDLYEQGVWPSTFNADHKTSFTLCKATSWSPVSVNVFDLVAKFCHLARPLSVATIDHAYRYNLPRFDQTSTPLCESAIEIILKKL